MTRPFNHTGPRQAPTFAAASFARQLALIEAGKAEPVLRVGNLAARRDLTDVRDVVAAYLHEAIVQPSAHAVPGAMYSAGGVSFMPATYGKDLAPDQVDHLVAYLTTFK